MSGETPRPVDGRGVDRVDLGGLEQSWLSASLDLISVVEIITVLVGARHTGALVVVSPAGARRIFFEEGRYRGSMSNHKADRLGEVLWRSGRISLDQMMIAAENITPQKKLGRCLVELGYLEVAELRTSLRDQSRAVFEAVCFETEGRATFLPDERHPDPVAFFDETEGLIDDVLAQLDERERILRRVGDLGQALQPASAQPAGQLGEAEEALLQLAHSAKQPQAAKALLEKANLYGLHGMRALDRLVGEGFLVRPAAAGEPARATREAAPRLDRLCEALRIVMGELDAGGFGLGETVREYCAHPPEELASPLEAVDLDNLDADMLREQAKIFVDGGLGALERGLSMLLDFALFEARDTLDEDEAAALIGKVTHLDVLL